MNDGKGARSHIQGGAEEGGRGVGRGRFKVGGGGCWKWGSGRNGAELWTEDLWAW